jgi:hypothetical protein
VYKIPTEAALHHLFHRRELREVRHAPERLQKVHERQVRAAVLVVALQVAFERQTLKPVFHFIGYRLWV